MVALVLQRKLGAVTVRAYQITENTENSLAKKPPWIRYCDLRDGLKQSFKWLVIVEVSIVMVCLSHLPKWIEEAVLLHFPKSVCLLRPSAGKVQLCMSLLDGKGLRLSTSISSLYDSCIQLSKTHCVHCMREKSVIFILAFRNAGCH